MNIICVREIIHVISVKNRSILCFSLFLLREMTSKHSNKRKKFANLLIFIYNTDTVDKLKETGSVCILKVHFLSNKRKSRSIPCTRTKNFRNAKKRKIKTNPLLSKYKCI